MMTTLTMAVCWAMAGAAADPMPIGGATFSPPKPSIVLMVADDLGWMDTGCYGNRHIPTPHIDRLAAQGMRFTHGYAASPICSPTRAAIVSGQWPARTRNTGQDSYRADPKRVVRRLLAPEFTTSLPDSAPRLGRLLAAAGYRCVHLGKVGVTGETAGYHVYGKPRSSAVEYLKSARSQPLFLHINDSRPHVPLNPEAADLKRAHEILGPDSGVNLAYAATVMGIDRTVGELMAAIAANPALGDTLFVFTSDNGGFLGGDPYARVTTNAPLREGKASLYEGGLRVPLVIRWPGVIQPGAVCSTPVSSVDFLSTFCAAAGIGLPEDVVLDGLDLGPLLRGEVLPARDLFWHWPHYRRAMPGRSASPSSAIRHANWKMIHFFEDNQRELYDLVNDPGETCNVIQDRPDVAQTLGRRLETWWQETGAVLPQANPKQRLHSSETASN